MDEGQVLGYNQPLLGKKGSRSHLHDYNVGQR